MTQPKEEAIALLTRMQAIVEKLKEIAGEEAEAIRLVAANDRDMQIAGSEALRRAQAANQRLMLEHGELMARLMPLLDELGMT
jgi:hypothetical protein